MQLQRAPAYPQDEALLVCVALAPTSTDKWRARIAGREVGVTRSIAFATTVIDLMLPMEMWAAGPFDYLHYYVSRSLLDRVSSENEVAPVDSYRMVFFEEDLVVAQLTKTILSQIRNREPLSLLTLEDISLLISTHLLQHYGSGSRELLRTHSGLESWQKIRVEELVRASLQGNIRIAELPFLALLQAKLRDVSSSVADPASDRESQGVTSQFSTGSRRNRIPVRILRPGGIYSRVYAS